jgi:hypothetical protein
MSFPLAEPSTCLAAVPPSGPDNGSTEMSVSVAGPVPSGRGCTEVACGGPVDPHKDHEPVRGSYTNTAKNRVFVGRILIKK